LKDVEEMRKIYDDFLKNYCCLAFISGKKTEGEKFAGAISTYTREI
jgi:prolyl-tRNA synthetase